MRDTLINLIVIALLVTAIISIWLAPSLVKTKIDVEIRQTQGQVY